MTAHQHCHHCGTQYAADVWPRACDHCGAMTFRNPAPVAVALVPMSGGGLLTVRRGIEPHIGALALPGGYIDFGETWQQACARELLEESGIDTPAEAYELQAVHSAGSTILIFGVLDTELDRGAMEGFEPCAEATELVVVEDPQVELAFPLHTDVARAWFAERA